MRCAVIAAVLLLVYIQDVAAGSKGRVSSVCKKKFPVKQCGGGWYQIDPRRCAKYFMEKKTFDDAENHRESLGSHLVSMHNVEDYSNVLCLALRTTKNKAHFWIGGTLTVYPTVGVHFGWTDGTRYNFQRWYAFQPDYSSEKCVEMNHGGWGRWNNAKCKLTQYCVCAKNM